jgi:hypothetical protein
LTIGDAELVLHDRRIHPVDRVLDDIGIGDPRARGRGQSGGAEQSAAEAGEEREGRCLHGG